MMPTRRMLALYADYLTHTSDEGLPALPLADLLRQLARAGERGVGDRPLAYAWGVPVELVSDLRSALGTATSEPRQFTPAAHGSSAPLTALA